MESTWHIWVIKINKFEFVKKYLDSLDEIEEYLYPTTTKIYINEETGEVTSKKVPLYSGYIFLSYEDTPSTFYKLNTYPFITTYVGECSGEDLEKVRHVRELEILNGENKKILVNDIVRVTSGPFVDFSGSVSSVINKHKIQVLLSIFGRDVNVLFSSNALDIIGRG